MTPADRTRSIHADAGRKGKAVEHLIAALCVLGSDGELNSWTSIVDDEGVDLVFQRRDGSATLAVQVKSRFTTARGLAQRQRFQTQVREVALRPRDDLYLLFVVADPEALDVGALWLVPSNDFVSKTRVGGNNKRKFVASAKEGSSDQWAEYIESKTDLPDRLLEVLADLA